MDQKICRGSQVNECVTLSAEAPRHVLRSAGTCSLSSAAFVRLVVPAAGLHDSGACWRRILHGSLRDISSAKSAANQVSSDPRLGLPVDTCHHGEQRGGSPVRQKYVSSIANISLHDAAWEARAPWLSCPSGQLWFVPNLRRCCRYISSLGRFIFSLTGVSPGLPSSFWSYFIHAYKGPPGSTGTYTQPSLEWRTHRISPRP